MHFVKKCFIKIAHITVQRSKANIYMISYRHFEQIYLIAIFFGMAKPTAPCVD